jgi:hypothetical protein
MEVTIKIPVEDITPRMDRHDRLARVMRETGEDLWSGYKCRRNERRTHGRRGKSKQKGYYRPWQNR